MRSVAPGVPSSGSLPKRGTGLQAKIRPEKPARPRNPNEATASVARKLWLLVELFIRGRVTFSVYHDLHRQEFRSFQRDLQQLRAALKPHGFTVSRVEQHAFVELSRSRTAAGTKVPADETARLIGAIAAALGEPITAALHVSAEAPDPFFTFAMPELVNGTRIAELATFFREAAFSSGGRAIIAFSYRGANRGERTSRQVEPYRLLVRSGIFYLLGYDRRRRAWRFFALDRIEGTPRREGTAGPDRTIPPEYLSPDTIGFIKGERPRKITVRLSPRVAAGATARKWQHAQQSVSFPDGSAEIAFTVTDEGEVIRWVLGFGADAQVIAPAGAVHAAASLVREIAMTYGLDAAPR